MVNSKTVVGYKLIPIPVVLTDYTLPTRDLSFHTLKKLWYFTLSFNNSFKPELMFTFTLLSIIIIFLYLLKKVMKLKQKCCEIRCWIKNKVNTAVNWRH